jgi:hypothetical protein
VFISLTTIDIVEYKEKEKQPLYANVQARVLDAPLEIKMAGA